MNRPFNFGAGPAALPEEVLLQAQAELLNWRDTGMSVVEVSHRSEIFRTMLSEAETDLRDLLAIPDNYTVLFLAAPSRSQYAMIPMNLFGKHAEADYLITGVWSKMAAMEGERYGKANIVASSEDQSFSTIPSRSEWQLNPNASFFHYVGNETVNGTEFPGIPDVGDVPIASDMTSTILSRPLDVSRFGIIYAGSQKNIAPAGLTVVIIRNDLLDNAIDSTPIVYDYKIQADNNSLYYTPSSFSCYMAGLMFRWLKEQGGLAEMEKRNQCKSSKLYQFIDDNDFYSNPIDSEYRSWMNVSFHLANGDLNKKFLAEAESCGLKALKGHRFVGGMRASLYNAMPEAGVDALIEFMQNFAKQNG